ncbi:VaFE repeat-containing surface-anchored protein [Corynebacterium sp. Marseille-P4611]|uniref:VaFE repeat-containing surface-anchored protein n=2 Tax=unclassified Corynebacterium TaxID=2624378 RepID=UPI001CE46E11|nr:VaFE repeat-containing surface-anchored protein [Corynebacterium sp. Marseille-P4611]
MQNIKAIYTYLTGESNVGQDEVKDSSNLTGKFVSHSGQDQVIIDTNSPSDSGHKKTPSIKTEAKFAEGSVRVVNGAVVTDTVTYEGLVPGKKYHLDATLMSKDGETELGTGEAEFTAAESGSGSTTVDITVKNAEKPVDAAVAFEELTSVEVNADGDETPDAETPNKIAEHKNLEDQAQTVTSKKALTPSIKTEAKFAEGSVRVVNGAVVTDTVTYEGLVPGKKYHLDATLMSKDGETELGTGEAEFTAAESGSGSTTVDITVKNAEKPVDAAVAFEELTSVEVNADGDETPDAETPNKIAEHKDLKDEDQTVPKKDEGTPTTELTGETTKPGEPTGETTKPGEPTGETTKPGEPTGETTKPGEPTGETTKPGEPTPGEHKPGEPWITTNADFANGSHVVVAGAKIVDEVTYEGLVPGKEYTLKAELINKEDGKSVLGTGEATFTPEKSKGMEPVTITVNDDVTEPVEAAVAFEELTSTEVNDKGEETPGTTPEKPNHIAEHKDINDKDQTVPKDTPGGSSNGSSNGSSKDNKWWLILIPGIGLGKIIKDHFDHKDHGNHNGGHGDNTSSHNGGHGDNTGNHNGGNGHEDKGQDAPKGGNSDNGNGRGVEVQGQQPEETGNALPSNADRVEIKSVPSGATELEPGMQDYIK